MKQSPPVPSLPSQMPFDIQQFIQQQKSSPPSILQQQQLSPSALAYLATVLSPQATPFCHSHPHPTPPTNVPTTQHHHSPPLFGFPPLSPQQIFHLLNSQILLQKQQQCNNNIKSVSIPLITSTNLIGIWYPYNLVGFFLLTKNMLVFWVETICRKGRESISGGGR
jgi:hypothetical protein